MNVAIALIAAWLPVAVQETPTRVIAREYVLDMPEQIPGPYVHLVMQNTGREPHYLRLLRIEGAQTLDDVAAWRKQGGALPPWLRAAGGAGTIAPGETVEFRAVVSPGRYLVLCGHPTPDGIPHVDKGMYRIITIGGSGDGASALADATIIIGDSTLTVYGLPRAGRYSFLIQNTGQQSHQALLVRLPDGVTLEQELAWFRSGSKGARPGHPIGGAIEIPAGEEARVTVALRPGRYAVFCAIPIAGQRAFDRGVLSTFDVRDKERER